MTIIRAATGTGAAIAVTIFVVNPAIKLYKVFTL